MDSTEQILEDARRAGIDLQQDLAPEEPMRRHDSALHVVLARREAGERRGKPAAIARTAQ